MKETISSRVVGGVMNLKANNLEDTELSRLLRARARLERQIAVAWAIWWLLVGAAGSLAAVKLWQ